MPQPLLSEAKAPRVLPLKYTKFGIAVMALYACESLMGTTSSESFKHPPHKGEIKYSTWELNISRQGILTGYEIEVYGMQVKTEVVTRSGWRTFSWEPSEDYLQRRTHRTGEE